MVLYLKMYSIRNNIKLFFNTKIFNKNFSYAIYFLCNFIGNNELRNIGLFNCINFYCFKINDYKNKKF